MTGEDPLKEAPAGRKWRERAECYENFLATTGDCSSDPHYTWGVMIVLVAVEELIDINPWYGLRFGNMDPVDEAGIDRYYGAGLDYGVSVSSQSSRGATRWSLCVWGRRSGGNPAGNFQGPVCDL
jgi:hypothetical protein